jgi:tetratricopeptide (TPR) repeat protein
MARYRPYVPSAGQLDAGAALIDRALALDPNLAAAWHLNGWVRLPRGEAETAIEHLARAMRLSPRDPLPHAMQNATVAGHLLAGSYDKAASWAERTLHVQPMRTDAAHRGSQAGARRQAVPMVLMEQMCRLDPGLLGTPSGGRATSAAIAAFRPIADLAQSTQANPNDQGNSR